MAHRGAPLAVCEADAQVDGAILVRLGGVALGGVVGDEGGGRRLQVWPETHAPKVRGAAYGDGGGSGWW